MARDVRLGRFGGQPGAEQAIHERELEAVIAVITGVMQMMPAAIASVRKWVDERL